MAIRILENQPILFTSEQDDCDCKAQKFCQIIAPTDPTQFQIYSDQLIENGDFITNLTGWNIVQLPSVELEITNETTIGSCDGEVVVTSDTGVLFSFNGGAFSATNTQTGLCSGCYNVTVQDIDGNQNSQNFCIVVNITCGDYNNTVDFVSVDTIELSNCYTTDFI